MCTYLVYGVSLTKPIHDPTDLQYQVRGYDHSTVKETLLQSLSLRTLISFQEKEGFTCLERSNSAVRTARDIQVDGSPGPARTKMV